MHGITVKKGTEESWTEITVLVLICLNLEAKYCPILQGYGGADCTEVLLRKREGGFEEPMHYQVLLHWGFLCTYI